MKAWLSLFSLLLGFRAGRFGYKRCPIKGLSAESLVNYQDFPAAHALSRVGAGRKKEFDLGGSASGASPGATKRNP